MPIVRIDLLEGRPQEKVRMLIARVSETVADVLDTPLERVRVVVNEVRPDMWGIGGVPASEARGNEAEDAAANGEPPGGA